MGSYALYLMPVIRMWGAERSGVNVKAARTRVNSGLARLEMEPCLKKKGGYQYGSIERTFA